MKLKYVKTKKLYVHLHRSFIIQAETLLGCSQLKDVTAAKNAVTQFYQKYSLPGCVLLTLGGQGLVYAASSTSPVKHVPAETVIAVDTTVSMYPKRL